MAEILFLEEVDSTNALAKAMAVEGHGECVVIANRQTAGRGRLGRGWNTAAGEGLWMTQLLRPKGVPADSAGGVVFVSALALAEALAPYANVEIKWPNDLIINKKKISGILAEAGFDGGLCAWIALGVGVNLLQGTFPPELPNATSVWIETGTKLAPRALLEKYLDRFVPRYESWVKEGLAPVLDAIAPMSATLNRRVRVDAREGMAVGFREDGALLFLEDGKKAPEALIAGDVSVRGLCGYI